MEDIQEYANPLALDDAYAASPKVCFKFPYDVTYTLANYGKFLYSPVGVYFPVTPEIEFCILNPYIP
jgi:hypothetical protein